MLHKLASDDGCIGLRWAAEDYRERDGDTDEACQKPAVQQMTTDDDDDDWILIGIYYCVSVPRIPWCYRNWFQIKLS